MFKKCRCRARSAEMCVSHMPSWKAKTLGKLTQEKVLLEPRSRFANSIPPFSLDKSTSSLTEARMPRQGSDKTDYRNLWRVGRIVHMDLFYRRGKKRKYQL